MTTITEAWLGLMMTEVSSYYALQSGGREAVNFSVLNWQQLPMTGAQWDSAGFGVGDIVRPIVAAAQNVSLDGFDVVVLVIDKPGASSAANSGDHRYIHVAAVHIDAALMQHELGHVFGADDAWADSLEGPISYGDQFCVMGNEDTKYSFKNSSLFILQDGSRADSGPGMTASVLAKTGWLNLDDPTVATNLTDSLRPEQPDLEIKLRRLHGAPAEGDRGGVVCAWADDVLHDGRLLIEYRTAGQWDRGLPASNGANGWVVLHVVDRIPAIALQIGAIPAAPGKGSVVWKAPRLHVSVTSTDAAAGTVTLRLRKPTDQTMWPFPAVFPTSAEQVSQAFRHRAIVASGKGFVGAFPNFYFAKKRGHEGRGYTVGGTIFLNPIAAEWRDVPLSELGNVALEDCLERFRATQLYAQAHGFVGGFPNFFHADYNDGRGVVCGTVLLKAGGFGAPIWRDVPLSELQNVSLDDTEGRFRATQDWAGRHGYVGGFPNMFHADHNDGRGIVCGTLLVNEGAQWQDVVVSLDPA